MNQVKINWTKQEQVKERPKFWINQITIFYGILQLVLSKKTTDINFTGKNIFFLDKTDAFIIIAVLILFNKIA